MSLKVFQIVTDRIVKLLEAGTVPWRKPWDGASAPHNIAGYRYNGINFFTLSMLGFKTPIYLSFNQIKKMGGRIKDGQEKAHAPVFFWKWLKFDKDQQGNDLTTEKTIPLVRYSLVWNIEQVDGIEVPAKFLSKVRDNTPLESAAAIVAGYKNAPKIEHGGNRACYAPTIDKVSMPELSSFHSSEEYYSTLFHELAHSTGHKSRLNRKEVMDAIVFGSHDYSTEELTAEMGAAFLCSHAGIDNTLDNSAAYIKSWIKKFKDDPKVLMYAAARAQKAFNHILDIQPETVKESEE